MKQSKQPEPWLNEFQTAWIMIDLEMISLNDFDNDYEFYSGVND